MTPDKLSEALELAGVPPRYRSCRFDGFDAHTKSLAEKLALVRRAADEHRGFLLFGPVGTGKSHLAVSTLAQWFGKFDGLSACFVSAAEFTMRVQMAYGNPLESVREILDAGKHAVLLDDLGAERSSETTRASLLFLIDQLYGAKIRLIATSNLAPKDLHAFEPRIASRLAQMGPMIELTGEDYRLRLAAKRIKANGATPVPKTLN
jgi:DNA replication protein DnaC